MRSLNLDQLRAFVETVDRGSITAAARILNLSQPAVTHQIQELEKRFQVSLLERLGKRLHLTSPGEKLLEYARQLLEVDALTQSSMRQFDGEWGGRVRIGTSATTLMYALPPILQHLKTDHPRLEITLKVGLTVETLNALKANTLDLGLCALPIADPIFETTHLFDDELVAILPPSAEAAPKLVTPSYFAKRPLILGNENSALRRDVDAWLSRAGALPKPLMVFDNVEAIKSLVAVGLGASIVPKLCLGQGHISVAGTRISALRPRVNRRVGLVRLRDKSPDTALQIVSSALMSLRVHAARVEMRENP